MNVHCKFQASRNICPLIAKKDYKKVHFKPFLAKPVDKNQNDLTPFQTKLLGLKELNNVSHDSPCYLKVPKKLPIPPKKCPYAEF